MKTFFQYVYGGYALLTFLITGLPAFLFYVLIMWLPTRTYMRVVLAYNRGWLTIWGLLVGITFKIRNAEKKDIHQTYVILPNHTNLFDIIMTGSLIQHPFKPLIKKELLKVPVLGQLLGMTSIKVDRSSKESRAQSMARMMDHIKKRVSILIFPEGTRNRTDKPLKEFYDGGFRLAIDAQIPVLPVCLLDIRHLQPVGTFKVVPGKVTLCYLDPVPTEGLTRADLPELKQKVFDTMYRFIAENDRAFKDQPLTSDQPERQPTEA